METTGDLSMEEGLKEFLKAAVDLVGGQRGLILTPIPSSQDMDVQASYSKDAKEDLNPETAWTAGQISQTIIRKVAQETKPLLSHNAMQDPRFEQTTSVVISGLRSVLAVPIMLDNALWGVLYVDNPIQVGAFRAADLNKLTGFTEQLAQVIRDYQAG